MKRSRSVCCAIFLSFCVWSGQGWATDVSRDGHCQILTQQVEVGGGAIHYRKAGEGPPVLLLHGLFAQKEQWDGVLCLLSAAGHAAIAPDLPGYGQSVGFPLDAYRLEKQVVLLDRMVKALAIARFDLGGNSMGGAIAVLYAQTHPHQVRSLALIEAPLGIVGWGDGVKEAIFSGFNPFIPTDAVQLDTEMHLLFARPPNIPEAAKAALVKDYNERNSQYQQIWNIVNLYGNLLGELPKPRVPTLIVWGRDDRIFEIEGAERLRQRIGQAKLVKLPNAGHLPHLEAPEETAAIYLRFLKR